MHDEQIYDAIIIGAGAGGVSCALWLARLGLTPLLIEAGARVGGLCLAHPLADDWNPSLVGNKGAEAVGGGFAVTTREGDVLHGRHLVLATGARARSLPEAAPAQDRARPFPGVLVGPGDHIVAQNFAGRRVAVLGGGDNGFENALYAMDHGAAQVHVYARSVRTLRQFVRRVPAGQVMLGDYTVDPHARVVNGRAYDLVLVFYGWEPCVGFAEGLGLARSERGFIQTDMATAQTSCQGVYAVGEVAQRFHPCVVTAMADGVTAAKAIQARIEACGR